MMTTMFNLLPEVTRARIAAEAASRRLYIAAGVMFVVAAALIVLGSWIELRSADVLAQANEAGAPVVQIENEIRAIEQERLAIAVSLDVQRALGVSIPASSLMSAIAQALPSGSVLDRVEFEYANVQGTVRKSRRVQKDTVEPRELLGEIAGIASSESQVGVIIDALEALALLSRVNLESSKSLEFRGKNAREFRITFRVELEKRWKLPAIVIAPREEQP